VQSPRARPADAEGAGLLCINTLSEFSEAIRKYESPARGVNGLDFRLKKSARRLTARQHKGFGTQPRARRVRTWRASAGPKLEYVLLQNF
jgi:hypothetical protein